MVFTLLARSRPRDSPISLPASIHCVIVTESMIQCTFPHWIITVESDGNIYILVHSLFWEYFVTHSFVCVPFPVYDCQNIIRLPKEEGR